MFWTQVMYPCQGQVPHPRLTRVHSLSSQASTPPYFEAPSLTPSPLTVILSEARLFAFGSE